MKEKELKTRVLIVIGCILLSGFLFWHLRPHTPSRSADQPSKVKQTTDPSGKETERVEVTPVGELRRKTTYKQDRPDTIQTFDAQGVLRSKDSCIYDDTGKLTSMNRVMPNGNTLQMLFYYDENGKELRRKVIDPGGREVPLEKQKEVWGD